MLNQQMKQMSERLKYLKAKKELTEEERAELERLEAWFNRFLDEP